MTSHCVSSLQAQVICHHHKPYTFDGGSENQDFFHTLLTFWPDFYYFHGDNWYSKNVDVYALFFLGGGGSQNVIKNKHTFKKSKQINRLIMDQIVNVLSVIDKAITVPQRATGYRPGLVGLWA